jgi:hypothetical protein
VEQKTYILLLVNRAGSQGLSCLLWMVWCEHLLNRKPMLWLIEKVLNDFLVLQRRCWNPTYFTCQLGGLTMVPMFVVDGVAWTLLVKKINIIILITHADCLTEWGTIRVRVCFMLARVRTCSLSPSLFLSLSLSPWPVKRVCAGHALCLQGCAHPLHWSDRERERVRERERERERERDVEYVQKMTGALASFSYLVYK